jgi:hypothetical protein
MVEECKDQTSEPAQVISSLPKQANFDSNVQLMSLQEHEAWLDRDGEQHHLDGNCSIGRAPLNTLVIDSPKVSRLHSIIQLEDSGAFWLIDLGSSNGTFLNKRRIHEPVRLHDQDEISIGGSSFIFHQPRGKPSAQLKPGALATLRKLKMSMPGCLSPTLKILPRSAER